MTRRGSNGFSTDLIILNHCYCLSLFHSIIPKSSPWCQHLQQRPFLLSHPIIWISLEFLLYLICTYVCVCMCMYMYMYECVCMYGVFYLCLCICMEVYVEFLLYLICTYVCVCMCMYMYMYECVCMYGVFYLCLCICMEVYVCVKSCPVF